MTIKENVDLNASPRLAPGCRLHPSEPMLLVPEGALKLIGPAREIVARIDGKRTVAGIVEELLAEYPRANGEEVKRGILGLLEGLQARGVVRV